MGKVIPFEELFKNVRSKKMSFKKFLKILGEKVEELRQAWEIENQAPEPPGYKKQREKWLKSLERGKPQKAPCKTPEGEKAFLLSREIMALCSRGEEFRLRPNQRDEYIRALRQMLKQMPDANSSPAPTIMNCILKVELKKRAGK